MCGIICYVGQKNAKPILIEGLKRLEYRGYDSAGLAVQNGNKISCYRELGKIASLEALVSGKPMEGTCGIAHTRWATHGEPSVQNAHPQRDQAEDVFVIHNGIIENYHILKKKLEKEGIAFRSETDTEVLAQLIGLYFDGDLADAVRKTMSQVEGTFGLGVIHRHVPGQIVVARRGSPLIIGVSDEGHFVASDVSAMVRYTNKVVHLQENELATVTADDFSISTASAQPIERGTETVEWSA
ncbi:MAG: glutamine--fructose-6-phosphate aminotransferase, partial [Deltaproteobacteria bacterium]|nr:glutamine--fructose-6-phosphate aminotransferase [Deltaproteobacteria bacterium]